MVQLSSISKKMKKRGNVYVLMGDGECQEGTTWESLLLASHHKLDNLIAIIDYNKIQGTAGATQTQFINLQNTIKDIESHLPSFI